MRKKVVSPGHRKAMAQAVVQAGLCSGRSACRYLKVSRSSYWYRGKPPLERQQALARRVEELSLKHTRYGYRRIAALLQREGWSVGIRTNGFAEPMDGVCHRANGAVVAEERPLGCRQRLCTGGTSGAGISSQIRRPEGAAFGC